MPVLTIEYQDEAERIGLEQAIAFFTQMRQTAQGWQRMARSWLLVSRVAVEQGAEFSALTLWPPPCTVVSHEAELKRGPLRSAGCPLPGAARHRRKPRATGR